jgi:hypothetical protein
VNNDTTEHTDAYIAEAADEFVGTLNSYSPTEIRAAGAAILAACEREAAERELLATPEGLRDWELANDFAVILRATPAEWLAAGISLEEAARRVAYWQADLDENARCYDRAMQRLRADAAERDAAAKERDALIRAVAIRGKADHDWLVEHVLCGDRFLNLSSVPDAVLAAALKVPEAGR